MNLIVTAGPVSEQVMLLENIGTSVLVTENQVIILILFTLAISSLKSVVTPWDICIKYVYILQTLDADYGLGV